MKIAVVGGGRSSEYEVSLASAAAVTAALSQRHQVIALTLDRAGSWCRGDERLTSADAVRLLSDCDVLLPMLHGPHGEDGTVAAFCDLIGVPVVGCGVHAGALAMDKWTTKLVAQAVGVRTAPGVMVCGDHARRIADGSLPAPTVDPGWSSSVVVKPVSAGSSDGVSSVADAADLPAAVAAALAHDDRVLIERMQTGREVDVAVLGRPDGRHLIPPLLGIVTSGIFDNTTKYDGSADFRIPASLPTAAQDQLRDAAIKVYDVLDCRGVVRVDFFWTEDGPVLNEVNTIPGFTEQSQVPKMFAAAGTGYAELLELMIDDAVDERTREAEPAVARR